MTLTPINPVMTINQIRGLHGVCLLNTSASLDWQLRKMSKIFQRKDEITKQLMTGSHRFGHTSNFLPFRPVVLLFWTYAGGGERNEQTKQRKRSSDLSTLKLKIKLMSHFTSRLHSSMMYGVFACCLMNSAHN